MEKIRVLVVDDQELIRRGLTMMLKMEPDIEVVGQASDGQAAVEWVRRYKPDVVLMDIKMPHLSGIQATRLITNEFQSTQVVILTTYDTDNLVFDAVRAGAHAYLLKDAAESEILEVIRSVHCGESRLDPAIARKVMDEFRRVSARLPLSDTAEQSNDVPNGLPIERLTEREAEILNLIAQGRTNQEISATLFLTEGTVKNYVSKIMAKLHTNDRTQLAIKALRSGLANLEP